MIEKRSKVIDGCTYELQELGGSEGYLAFHRLLKIAGPAFPQIGALLKKGEGSNAKEAAAVALLRTLPQLLEQAHPQEVLELGKKLLEGSMVTVPGKTEGPVPLMQIFDVHFKGKLLPMLELFAFGVEVNFASFFPAALARLAGAVPTKPK